MYALISFVNHYLFRTYALDLGLYTNAMQRYISGMAPDTKMFWAPS
ncbi:MAG: putative membrane protein, partial [Flavobacteriales bacterium]